MILKVAAFLGAWMLAWPLTACGGPAPGPKVAPAKPETAVTAPTDTPSPTAHQRMGIYVDDVRQFDWSRVLLPPDVCGVEGRVELTARGSRQISDRWGGIRVFFHEVKFGEFLTLLGPQAAVSVFCDNGGGTASSILEHAIVMYSSPGGELTALGVITAQKQAPDQPATLLALRTWRPSAILVTELYYRAGDATCCPSGRAVTTWTYEGEVLVPGPPHVIK